MSFADSWYRASCALLLLTFLPLSFSLSCFLFLSLSLFLSLFLSLSLFISAPSFSLWLQDTCHLMPFTKYSLLDQSYFFTPYLSIAHIKFTNYSPTIFYDYHPQSCLKNIFFALGQPSSSFLEENLQTCWPLRTGAMAREDRDAGTCFPEYRAHTDFVQVSTSCSSSSITPSVIPATPQRSVPSIPVSCFHISWSFDAFFPRASERRVLPIVGVCKTSSHLHIFSSSPLLIFTSSHIFSHLLTSSHIFPHLHIFSSSHLLISHLLLIFSSSHLLISSSSHLLILTSSPHLLIFTSSHLHIFSSSHLLTSSHIFSHLLTSSHIFTSSHLHIFSSSHLTSSPHLLIFTSSHLLIFTSSHPHIFSSSSHLHIFSSPHLLIFTSSHLHIFSHILTYPHIFSHLLTSSHIFSHLLTSSHTFSHLLTSSHIFSHLLTSSHIFSHLLIFTSSHLTSSPLALLPSCPLALSFFSISLLKAGAGQCQRDGTKRNLFARNEGRSSKTEVKLRFYLCRSNPFARNEGRSSKTEEKLRFYLCRSNPFARNEGRSSKTAVKLRFYLCRSNPFARNEGRSSKTEVKLRFYLCWSNPFARNEGDRQKLRKNCDFTCAGATLSHEMRVIVKNCGEIAILLVPDLSVCKSACV